MKVAKISARVAGPSVRSVIRKGKVYEDNDPVVKAHPDLFENPEDSARRRAPYMSTADLGSRSMSSRKLKRTETARQSPEGRTQGITLSDVAKFQCETCGFSAKSKAGLAVHRRKH